MVTTTSSTSTATPTPTATRSSVTSTAAASLLQSLDAGSGIDTGALVTSLVEAQFAAKTAALTTRQDRLTAQISGISTLKSTIADFTKALESLVKNGTLASQPVSSDTKVLTATALSGAKLNGLSASVRVDQLAAAQTAITKTAFAAASTTVGTGTLTLKFGTGTFNSSGAMTKLTQVGDAISIDITSANSSLDGIAKAINAKNAGVTASVITNVDGKASLSLKGATGSTQAFTLEATSRTSGDLRKVAVGVGATNSTITAQARNAKLTVDGVAVERTSNSISDLVAGVKLDLTAVSATPVALSSTTPTAALSTAVSDFVETYNQVVAVIKEQTDPINGALRGDMAAKNLLRSMQALTMKTLVPNAAAGAPATLSALGIGTTRDGTLSLNADTLAAAIKDNPAAVEAMFAFTSDGTGLYAAMNSVNLNAGSTIYGLGASTTRYRDQLSEVGEQQGKVKDQAAAATTRLTSQFMSMNARVAAYKATQSYMKQQIDMWTKSSS